MPNAQQASDEDVVVKEAVEGNIAGKKKSAHVTAYQTWKYYLQ